MNNFVLFTNRFLEYLITFIVFVVVVGIGVTIGILLRKRKNKKEAELQEMSAQMKESEESKNA